MDMIHIKGYRETVFISSPLSVFSTCVLGLVYTEFIFN